MGNYSSITTRLLICNHVSKNIFAFFDQPLFATLPAAITISLTISLLAAIIPLINSSLYII